MFFCICKYSTKNNICDDDKVIFGCLCCFHPCNTNVFDIKMFLFGCNIEVTEKVQSYHIFFKIRVMNF